MVRYPQGDAPGRTPTNSRRQQRFSFLRLSLLTYNDYIAAEHSFDTTRKAGWIADSLAIPGLRLTSPPAATREQLLDVRSAEYVDAVISGEPASLARSHGFT